MEQGNSNLDHAKISVYDRSVNVKRAVLSRTAFVAMISID